MVYRCFFLLHLLLIAGRIQAEEISYRLISDKMCPYGQRVNIALMYKGVDFDTRWINVKNPPHWLRDQSPEGKVPVLTGDKQPLTSSMVILQYLDEQFPKPALYPKAPIERAMHNILADMSITANERLFQILKANTRLEVQEDIESFHRWLGIAEAQFQSLPDFSGELSIADIAWAPFFMRLDILSHKRNIKFIEGFPGLKHWQNLLLARAEVKASVDGDFAEQYISFLGNRGSWAVSGHQPVQANQNTVVDFLSYCY